MSFGFIMRNNECIHKLLKSWMQLIKRELPVKCIFLLDSNNPCFYTALFQCYGYLSSERFTRIENRFYCECCRVLPAVFFLSDSGITALFTGIEWMEEFSKKQNKQA